MGSGSWGTGFGMVLADAGGDVAMWAREDAVVEDINQRHHNSAYHEGIELPPSMWASGDPVEVLNGAQIVVLAIPSQTLRENFCGATRKLVPRDGEVQQGIAQRSPPRSEVLAAATGRQANGAASNGDACLAAFGQELLHLALQRPAHGDGRFERNSALFPEHGAEFAPVRAFAQGCTAQQAGTALTNHFQGTQHQCIALSPQPDPLQYRREQLVT